MAITVLQREIVTHNNFLPSSEIEITPKTMPHANYCSVIQNTISNFMDPVPREQVYSTNIDTSVGNNHNRYTCKVRLKTLT